jgi:hypothetical protein
MGETTILTLARTLIGAIIVVNSVIVGFIVSVWLTVTAS